MPDTTPLPRSRGFAPEPVEAKPVTEFDFSLWGKRLVKRCGIVELMDDLGAAMTDDPSMRMLGGGNPAAVPALQARIRERMQELLQDGGCDRMIGNYDPPQGNPRFLRAMAALLQREFGWNITPANIAVTAGGQSTFFCLFNVLGGRFAGGRQRKILLPLAPEYIGYADQGLEEGRFVSCRPIITWPDGEAARVFKYSIDFAAVTEALRREPIGAIAVSRPSNPSGNVLTDAEVKRLSDLAAEFGIPLILDNAYGAPFPGVMFVPARPFWAPHVILTLSLSKLGLPGTRTGIVIAPEPIIAAMRSMTTIVGLANGNVGQQIVLPWIEDGSILQLGPEVLRPFYEERNQGSARYLRECMDAAGVNWAMHTCEGALFHWLWLRDLPISSRDFYQRLKVRKVLTVPGEYFFFGLPTDDWSHAHQCLRLNYSQAEDVVHEGLTIIAEEAARLAKT